jgi:hypothetical protein
MCQDRSLAFSLSAATAAGALPEQNARVKMLKRSTRLVAAVAAAGTICALGAATAASASATGPWSGRVGPVPGAFTNAAPSLASVTFGASSTFNTVVAWRGQAGGKILYKSSPALGVKGDWTPLASVPGASTSSAPSIAAYRDPNGREAVVAVWRATKGNTIDYAQGETEGNHQITWTAVSALPKSTLNVTDAAPAVFFPAHRYAALVAFRGPHDHIRFITGIPSKRGFKWSASSVVNTTAVAATGPAIAEVQTSTAAGSVYVFWKDQKSTNISYSTTPDPLTIATGLKWSVPVILAGSDTSNAPAASSVGPHGAGPLLLAYKAPHNTSILYRTLSGGTWSAAAVVPTASTTVSPALLGTKLANTSPGTAGNIFFHIYS